MKDLTHVSFGVTNTEKQDLYLNIGTGEIQGVSHLRWYYVNFL